MANKNVKVIVLRTAGTNCNEETAFAFARCGADVEQVHVNALAGKTKRLSDYHILALPGGFSYGDDIASGRILANELRLKLGDDLRRFIADGKLAIGICNGFQVLVKAGILPGQNHAKKDLSSRQSGTRDAAALQQQATLFNNDSAKFEARWTHLTVGGKSVWTKGMPGRIDLPVAHGEGKFIPASDNVLQLLKQNSQIVFRYCAADGGKPAYPGNPNGSVEDIAGICDTTGRVLGLMPHPERHFFAIQHPSWTRRTQTSEFGDGAKIFENGVDYVRSRLL